MAERRLDISIGAKDQTGPAFASAAAKAKALQGQLSASGLKGIKAALGEESALGGIAKMLTGAGAIAGAVVAARVIGDMAMKAGELAEAMGKGSVRADEFIGAMAKGVPIVGDLYRGAEKLWQTIAIPANWTKELEAGIGSSAALRQKMLAATGQTVKAAIEAADAEQSAAAKKSHETWGAMTADPAQGALARKQMQIDADNAQQIHDATVRKAVADDDARRQAEVDKRQADHDREVQAQQKLANDQLDSWKRYEAALTELRATRLRNAGRQLDAELAQLRGNLRLRLAEVKSAGERELIIAQEQEQELRAIREDAARQQAQRQTERGLAVGNRGRLLALEGRGGEAEQLGRAEDFRSRIIAAHTPGEAGELARQWILEEGLARQRATPVYASTAPSRFVSPGYTDLAGDARAQAQDAQITELKRISELTKQELAGIRELVRAVREQGAVEGVELNY